jgi:Flp pilus assembly protein TadD
VSRKCYPQDPFVSGALHSSEIADQRPDLVIPSVPCGIFPKNVWPCGEASCRGAKNTLTLVLWGPQRLRSLANFAMVYTLTIQKGSKSIAIWLPAATLWALLALDGFAQSTSFEDAMKLFRQKQWAAAAAAFENLEKSEPTKTEVLLFAGKSLLNLGHFADAANALSTYLSFHPESDEAAYLLAYTKFRENKPVDSLTLFTAAAKIKPPRADDLKIVALDYELLDDQASAAKYLEQALAMQPGNVEVLYYLGRVRYQQNQFVLAITAFEEVLSRDPTHAKAENNLGLSLEAMNRAAEAMNAYRKAVALDKSSNHHSEQPYLNLATLLTRLDNATESVPLLRQAVLIAPNSSQVHYQLGKAFFNLGRLEEARSELQDSESLAASESSTHYLLGRLYRRLGDAEAASREFALTEDLLDAKRRKLAPTEQERAKPQ